MTVKELKDFLENFKDEQEIILNSESGIEWKICPVDIAEKIIHNEKYKNKPVMDLRVK